MNDTDFMEFFPAPGWIMDWNKIPKHLLDSAQLVKSMMKKDGDGKPLKTKENCLIALQINFIKNVGWHRKSVNVEQKAMDGFPFPETEAAAAPDTG